MRNNLIKKALSIASALSILVNISSQTHAADLAAIPQNVRPPILTPAPTQTRSTELSFQSFEAKISNVFKPKKEKAKLAATYSGTCGDNVNWNLDTSTCVLTISGSGAMTKFTSIGSPPWSSYRSSIKTVVIANGVTFTGWFAFSHCTSLTSVTIPNSVTLIGSCTFQHCSKLTSVTIPNSVTVIEGNAFYGCSSLTSVTIPASVTVIEDNAFYGCSSLTSVTIPASVTKIWSRAFQECLKLTSVTYKGTSDPGASYSNVFLNAPVTSVKVPWNYKDSTFCGVSVARPPAPTPTRSRSPSQSRSPSRSRSRSQSRSRSPIATRSRSPLATPSKSPTASPSNKFTAPLDYFQRKLKTTTIAVYRALYHTFVLE